ncbi:cyclic-nucleotide signal transduction protein, partial [Arthrobacter crystallopoietes BAB-32]
AEVTSTHLAAVRAAMIDAVFRRALEIDVRQAELETFECSWLLFGSIGRREPLPNSDVNTALVWQPRRIPNEPAEPERLARAATGRLQALAGCGLNFRPNEANASNPLYARSVDQWRQEIARWASAPQERTDIVLASALLDARPITEHGLGQVVLDLVAAASAHRDFRQSLTRSALEETPPAGFVRGFVIERLGERRALLDLKQAGLRPVVSLARALALWAGDVSGTTPERLETAAAGGLLSQEECESMKGAFSLYHEILFEQEIEDIRNGTQQEVGIDPGQLDPVRRRHLREGFRAIERIQNRVANDREIGLTSGHPVPGGVEGRGGLILP